jgi:hypothetical protein
LSVGLASEISTGVVLSTGLVTETTRATNAETSLSVGLASEISTGVVLSTGLVTETTRATNAETSLSTAVVTETTRATNAETSLSVGLASEISTGVVLSTGLVTETTRATNAETSLSSGLAAAVSVNVTQSNSIVSLSTGLAAAVTVNATQSNSIVSLSTGLAAAVTVNATQSNSIVSLSTGLAAAVSVNVTQSNSIISLSVGLSNETTRATNAETSLSVGLASEISSRISEVSSVNASLVLTNASFGLLSSALALESTRATNAETSLSSGLAAAVTVNTTQTNSIVSLSTGLAAAVTVNTTQTNSIVSLSVGASTINVNLSMVQRMAIQTEIVPINTTTIVAGSQEPIYVSTYPIGSLNTIDGWRYYKPVSNTTDYINWGNTITNATGVTSTLTGSNLTQVYFKCYIFNTPIAVADLPFLSIVLGASIFNFTMSSITGITGGKSYTFVANLNGTVSIENYFNSSIQSLSLGSFVYASNTANTLSFISVKSNPASTSVNFILQDIQVEVQSNGNANILSKTYQMLFMNASVNDKYMYNATNYLYSYFFQQPMLSIVSYNS